MTLPLFRPPRGKPYGWQEPKEWNAFAKWMRDNELLENRDRRRRRVHERVPARRRPLTHMGG